MSPVSEEELRILKSFSSKIATNDSGARNNLAVVYFNKGLYTEAIEELKKALEIDPNFTLAKNNLELVLRKSGKYREYLDEMEREVARAPADESKQLELAETFKKMGNNAMAISSYTRVLELNPNSVAAHNGLGVIYKTIGRYEDSINEFKKAIEISATAPLYRHLGEAYFNRGAIDLAVTAFKKALELDPNLAEVHFLMGFAYGEKGLFDDAFKSIRRATELNPALAQFEPNLPIDLKRHKGYAEILKMSLEKPKIAADEFVTRMNLGINFRLKGLFNESIKEFETCLELDDKNKSIYNYLGEVQILAGRLPEAITTLAQGFKLFSQAFEIANALGVVSQLSNQRADANKWYQKALSINKTYGPTLNNIGVCLLNDNKYAEAISYLERAQKDNCLDANYNLGYIALSRGDFDRALKLFSGEVVEDLLGRGLIALNLGHDEEAVSLFKQILSIAPNCAAAYYNLGMAFSKMGNFEQSLEYIKKGIELDPKYEKEHYRLALSNELAEFGIYVSAKMGRESIIELGAEEEIFPDLELETAEKQYELALDAFNKMELERSEEIIEELLKIDQNHLSGRILKSKILNLTGEREEALIYLDKIVNEAPDNIEALELTGTIYLKDRKFSKAQSVFSRLNNMVPENIFYLVTLGNIDFEMGQLDEAVKRFQRACELEPNHLDANLGLARILLKKEKLDETANILDGLSQHYKDNYEIHILYGLYFIKKRDYSDAVKKLTKAITIDPSKSLPYYHLGLIYTQKGQFDDACNAWKKGLLLNPEPELAKKIRNCLEVTIELEELLKKGEEIA